MDLRSIVREGPPFSAGEYAARKARTCRRLAEEGFDAILVTGLENICYLTGYETNGNVAVTGLVLSQDGRLHFFTRSLDLGNLLPLVEAAGINAYSTYQDNDDPITMLAGIAAAMLSQRGRIAVEKESLSAAHYEQLAAVPGRIEWVDSAGLISRLRLIKSDDEITYHRAAAQIAVRAMKAGVEACRVGVRDNEVAGIVLQTLAAEGGSWVANWPYVKVGANTGRGHATWQNAVLERSMPLTIELAGVIRRYHSPLYRTIIFKPDAAQRRLADAVAGINRVGISQMKPGKTAEQVYATFKDCAAAAGYSDLLRHRNGYCVGIGFPPNWVQRPGIDIMAGNEIVLEPGMVFHTPTYLCDVGTLGMGQSHTVLITAEGHEVLTANMSDGPFLEG
jgi:Xaa-Pro dipeptidase